MNCYLLIIILRYGILMLEIRNGVGELDLTDLNLQHVLPIIDRV